MKRSFMRSVLCWCAVPIISASPAFGGKAPAPTPTPKPSPSATANPSPSATAAPSATASATPSGGGKKPSPTPAPTPIDGQTNWNGSTSSDFNTAGNWTPTGGTPGSAPPVAGDVAWFTSTPSNKNVNLSSSVSLSGFYFNGTSASGYNITSSTPAIAFTLTAFGTVIGAEQGDANAVAIGAENTSGTNTISAPIILAPTTGTTSTIFQATGGTMVLSGVISGSGIGLTKTGGGQTNLTGTAANTYNGLTTVSAGTLGLGKSAGINAFGGDLLINGGTVSYSVANDNQIPDTATVTLTSGTFEVGARTETIGALLMSGGSLNKASGTLTLGGPSSITGGTVTLTAATSRINTSGTLTLGGATFNYTNGAAASQGLVLGGDVMYAASNTAAGTFNNTLAGAGRINLNGANRTFNIADSTTLPAGTPEVQIAWSLQNGSLTKTGSGTLLLSGPNTYTGSTTISGGTLVANVGTLVSTSSVTVNSGGTLLLSGNGRHLGANTGVTLAGGTFDTGGFSEPNGGPSGLATSYIGALTLTATSTINFGAGASSILEFAGLGTHTVGTILQITNWDGVPVVGGAGDRLLFAGLANSFTTAYAQNEVSFNGISGYSVVQFDLLGTPYYEVTAIAIPEPGTWIGGALALAAVVFARRRKLRSYWLSVIG